MGVLHYYTAVNYLENYVLTFGSPTDTTVCTRFALF